MQPPLFLEPLARPLLVVHAFLAMATLGASVHLGVLAATRLGGRPGRPPLDALYVRILAVLYPLTFATGAALYPTYRVRVRQDVLDVAARWASNAFDIKENVAVLGLFLVVGLALTRPRLSLRAGEPGARLHALASLCLALLLALMVVLGLLVTAEEGV